MFIKRNHLIRKTFVLFCCWSWLSCLCGQTTGLHFFHHLGIEDGLADQEYNYYLHQDPEGFVWISSIAGLHRYDGKQLIRYLPDRKSNQALRSIYASTSTFFDTADGNLWFTEDEGIVRYDRQSENFRMHHIPPPLGDTIGYSWAYVDTSSQKIWCQLHRKLYRGNFPSLSGFQLVDTFLTDIEAVVTQRQDDFPLLFSVHHGAVHLRVMDTSATQLSSVFLTLPNQSSALQVYPLADNNCWIISDNGLYHYNYVQNRWRKHPLQYQNKELVNLIDVVAWRPDSLLLATETEGIYLYRPSQERVTTVLRQYDGETIRTFRPKISFLELDQDDNLWVSTSEGIYFTNLRKPKFDLQLLGSNTISLTEGNTPTTLLALSDSCYYEIDYSLNTVTRHPLWGVPPDTRLSFLHQDQQQRVWLGTEAGLYWQSTLSAPFKKFRTFSDCLPADNYYQRICTLPDNSMVLGTVQSAAIILAVDGQHCEILDATRKGTVFVGFAHQYLFTYSIRTNKIRPYFWQKDQLIVDSIPNAPATAIVNQIVYDSLRSCYWVAADDGLWKLSKQEKWEQQAISPFKATVCRSIALAEDGKLWLGASGGLISFDPDKEIQQNFTASDLTQAISFNRHAAITTKEGRVFLGGSNGINSFMPAQTNSKLVPARPVISEVWIKQLNEDFVRLEQKNIRQASKMTPPILNYTQNTLRFTLTNGEYSDPAHCTFYYQLNGYQQGVPDKVSDPTRLQFDFLSPEDYELLIWATNADGRRTDTPTTFYFTIRPPWYLSAWFLILSVGISLLLSWMLYRLRLKEITQKQHLKTATLYAQNEAVGANLKRAQAEMAVFRLQMNPHFIFNALNAIISLLKNKEREAEAPKFLRSFSQLMRQVLLKSEQELHSLEDEIALLEKYITLEQLRLQNRFIYTINCAEDLDTFDTQIPTMILQPFVENAIQHGLRLKKNQGNLTINFFANEHQQLVCEVSDNGIGRAANTPRPGHTSKAMGIIDARLALLSKDLQLDPHPHYQVLDQYDVHGQSTGTIVRLFFPLAVDNIRRLA